MPITYDSGADISVLPEESVLPEQFTGTSCEIDSFNKIRSSGKLCNVTISINGMEFMRKAVTQPGKDLAWTACLSLPYANKADCDFIMQKMQDKFRLTEEETLYLPPEIRDGILKSGLMESEGTLVVAKPEEPVVETQDTPNLIQLDSVVAVQQKQENSKPEEDVLVVEETDEQNRREEDVLDLVETSIVDAEVAGDSLGGRAEVEGAQDISMGGITETIPRIQLAQATCQDKSLKPLLKLAENSKEGYYLSEGVLFRTRLDSFGQTMEQICLPTKYRDKCLKLTHNHFGHEGRNKVV